MFQPSDLVVIARGIPLVYAKGIPLAITARMSLVRADSELSMLGLGKPGFEVKTQASLVL